MIKSIKLYGQLAGILLLAGSATAHSKEITVPISGTPVVGMKSIDQMMAGILSDWDIPGAALSIAKDGKLVFSRGYGYADLDSKSTVQPDSLFRIASVSKTITAAAILKLVEDGKLHLDDKAEGILFGDRSTNLVITDGRIRNVTIRHLIDHTAGWDRKISGNPFMAKILIDHENCDRTIRYRFQRALDFDPGERVAYSNVGYCVLGQVIEKISGQSYETYIRTQFLKPAGIRKMQIAGPSASDRVENEVKYLGSDGRSPYDTFALRALKASAGWVASAVDLVRFALVVDGFPNPPDVLSSASIREMVARAEAKSTSGQRGLYSAKGWDVFRVDGVRFWAKGGGMAGTRAILVRADNGVVWAALFNTNPRPYRDFFRTLFVDLPKTIHLFSDWPTHDLFLPMKKN